ncbi:hypothetical protein BDF14DRAFT_1993621 [Spinellus fusiger]|nr:hypothetical protein BDF14DRAFT_1993621 [Spinellus fusiger]
MLKSVLIPVLALASLVSAHDPFEFSFGDHDNIITLASLRYSIFDPRDFADGLVAKDFPLSKGSVEITAHQMPLCRAYIELASTVDQIILVIASVHIPNVSS